MSLGSFQCLFVVFSFNLYFPVTMIDYCVHLVLVLNKGGYKSYLTMHALAVQSRNIKQSESEPVVLCEVDLPLC